MPLVNAHSLARTLLVSALLMTSAFSLCQATLEVGSKAPPLKIDRWLKGTAPRLDKDRKVQVIEFWATWCGPCKESIPHLTDLAKKFKDKVDFVGVSVWEVPEGGTDPEYVQRVEKFVLDMGDQMGYNVALDGPTGEIANTWLQAAGINGIPMAMILDKENTIVWMGHPMSDLGPVLEQVVEGKFDRAKYAAEQKKKAEAQKQIHALYEQFEEAADAGDAKKAIGFLDQIFEVSPESEVPYGIVKFEFLLEVDEKGAYTYGKGLMDRLYGKDALRLNHLARTLVDGFYELKTPDYPLAVTMAEKAVQIGQPKDQPALLDTLAMAYEKTQEKEKAVATLTKAIGLAEKTPDFPASFLADMRERLAALKKK